MFIEWNDDLKIGIDEIDEQHKRIIEEFEKFGMYITRTIVIESEAVKIYLKVKHDWGEVFFFRNNQSISEELYTVELERI